MLTPYYEDPTVTILQGDCIDVMREMPDNSIDSICTDPPYGLGFMGKAWDALPPGEEWARECLRVLKPGGHVLAFGGSRTWHRLAVAIEDAGFELRDSIAWLYGSGFPKSLDVSKAIDKAAGAEREVLSETTVSRDETGSWAEQVGSGMFQAGPRVVQVTAPATEAAQRWAGWGTALKPAFEPVVVGRKPLVGTVASNVLQHRVGALNIDASRTVGGDPGAAGRWPTNVALDNSQAAALDEQTGTLKSGANPTRRSADKFRDAYGDFAGQQECTPARGADSGGASRFFPVFDTDDEAPPWTLTDGTGAPNAVTSLAGQTTDATDADEPADLPTFRYQAKAPSKERPKVDGVAHPTVKPLDLMRWLVRLVTPPGGTVLEPFLGSGTTAEACRLEGFRCIGIERDETYLPLTLARLGVRRAEDIPPWELDEAA